MTPTPITPLRQRFSALARDRKSHYEHIRLKAEVLINELAAGDPMYGPAVRRKLKSACWRFGSRINVSGLVMELSRSGPSWISARRRLISGQASSGY